MYYTTLESAELKNSNTEVNLLEEIDEVFFDFENIYNNLIQVSATNTGTFQLASFRLQNAFIGYA